VIRTSRYSPAMARAVLISLLMMMSCLLASCASNLASIVQTGPYGETREHRFPVRIVGVDGKLINTTYIVLEPGAHTLLVLPEAGPSGLGGGSSRIPAQITINVKPCMNYYLALDLPNTTSLRGDVVVDYMVPTGKCDSKTAAPDAG